MLSQILLGGFILVKFYQNAIDLEQKLKTVVKNDAINIGFAYGTAYTVMALVFDNPVLREKFFTPFTFLACGVWLFEYICKKKQINPQKADNILGIVYILAIVAGAIVGIWF